MNRSFRGAALALALCTGAMAFAQEPTAREQQLEDLVRSLTERVEQLESRLDQMAPQQEQQTQVRVEQLEETVKQMQEDRPPPVDSEQWKQMSKWVNDSNSLRP